MKKIVKYLSLIIMIFNFCIKLDALGITQSEYENLNIKRGYIVGEYIFNIDEMNPTLKDLMLAAQTSPKGDVSIIEIKISRNLSGEITKTYKDILNTERPVMNTFPTVDVRYVYEGHIIPEDPQEEDKTDLAETLGYKVDFYDGEKLFYEDAVSRNTKVSTPNNTKIGYIFDNWYTTAGFAELFNFDTLINSNTNIYGKWTANQYNIVFEDNTEDTVTNMPSNITKTYGVNSSEINVPKRTGYEFIGWNKISDALSGNYNENIINSDLTNGTTSQTLYAIWNSKEYTVTFNYNGGEEEIENKNVTYDSTFGSLPTTSKLGYRFIGWYLNDTSDENNLINEESVVEITEDTTVYAKWIINQYTMSFNTNGGNDIEDITEDYNALVETPKNPIKAGYSFAGWYSDSTLGNAYIITNMPAGDIELYAKWTANQYDVLFEDNTEDTVTNMPSNITKTYGVNSSEINIPERIGYEFLGWNINNAASSATITNNIISSDLTNGTTSQTLYAIWNKITYNIEYDLDGGSVEGTNLDTYQIDTDTFTLINPTKANYTFDGWKLNNSGDLIDSVTITKGSTGNKSYTAYWTIKQYTINFESNEGSSVTSITQDYGSNVSAPVNPTKTGYNFVGWYSDPALLSAYEFTTMPSGGKTLYAKWDAIEYTISFNSNGGSVVPNISDDYGKTINAPVNPTKAGYEFGGWYNDSNLEEEYEFSFPTTMPAENAVLYAKWTPVSYTITYYELNGITNSNPTSYTIEDTPITLSDLSGRTAYTFNGWVLNENTCASPYVTQIPSNSTGERYYKACWTSNRPTINFNSNGGSTVRPLTGDYGDLVSAPKNPIKEGYTFDKWQLNGNDYTITSIPESNITLDAVWIPRTYTLKLSLYNGVSEADDICTFGSNCNIFESNHSRSGYTFDGWDTDESADEVILSSDTLTINNIVPDNNNIVTLYAVYSPINYLIVYEKNSLDATGSMINKSCNYDGICTLDNFGYSRDGYSFIGWATTNDGSVEYDNQENIADYATLANASKEVHLYAIWSAESHSISFVSNGGSTVGTITKLYGEIVNEPTEPTKTGNEFVGWYTDGNLNEQYRYSFSTMPSEDIVLWAKWNVLQYYFSFNTNGGSSLSPVYENYGNTVNSVPEPLKSGYEFDGWYTNSNLEEDYKLNFPTTMPAENTMLYAKWTPVIYSVTYLGLNDLTNPNPTSYTVEDTPIILSELTGRTGYTFNGWSKLDRTCSDPFVTEIPANFGGNIVYHACWTADTYSVYTINRFSNNGEAELYDTYDIEHSVNAPNDLNKTGYEFDGWYTEAAHSNIVTGIPVGSIGNVYWYAKWTANTYLVTLDYNDASDGIGITSLNLVYDNTYGTLPTPSKTGYNFVGWALPDGQIINNDTKVSISNNHTITATWSTSNIIINYDNNGGNGTMASTSCTYGQSCLLSENTFTKDQNVFLGWSIHSDSSIIDYSNGSDANGIYAPDGDITLYAVWASSTYAISYDANGEGVDNLPNNGTKNYGVNYVIPSTVPTREGYLFGGWYLNDACSGTEYLQNSEYSTEASVVFYAKWVPITYKIEYYYGPNDEDRNDVEVADTTCSYDLSFVISNNGYRKDGYHFDHWNTSFDNSGTSYTEGQVVDSNLSSTNNSTVKLFAIWEANSYCILFNENTGGESADNMPDSITKVFGSSYNLDSVTKPTRNDYRFLGWDDHYDVTVPKFTNNIYEDLTFGTDNQTLYAIWQEKDHVELNGYGPECVYGQQGQCTRDINDNIIYNDDINSYHSQSINLPINENGGVDLNSVVDLDIRFKNKPYYEFKSWHQRIHTIDDEDNKCLYYDENFQGNMWQGNGTYGDESSGRYICYNGDEYAYDEFDFENIMPGENVVVFALFDPIQYNLTINYNYQNGPSSYSYGYGYDTMLNQGNPSRKNYIFVGWHDSPSLGENDNVLISAEENDTSIRIADIIDKFDTNKELTLYAIWQDTPGVDVTYKGYGRLCNDFDQDGECDTYPDGSINYTLGGNYDDPYQYGKNEVTQRVEDYANPDLITDFEIRLKNKQSSTFEGWHQIIESMSPDCVDENNNPLDDGLYGEEENQFICINKDKLDYNTYDFNSEVGNDPITLVAMFSSTPYTIYLDANNNIVSENDSISVVYRQENIELPNGEDLTKPNQYATFIGWSDEKNTCEEYNNCYTNGRSITSYDREENLTLYAVWSYSRSNIYYNPNDGETYDKEDLPNNIIDFSEESYTINSRLSNYNNKYHLAWIDSPTFGEDLSRILYPGDVIELANSDLLVPELVLYAYYVNPTIEVRYINLEVTPDDNITTPIENVTATYGQDFTFRESLSGVEIPEGKKFAGWMVYDEGYNSDKVYGQGDIITFNILDIFTQGYIEVIPTFIPDWYSPNTTEYYIDSQEELSDLQLVMDRINNDASEENPIYITIDSSNDYLGIYSRDLTIGRNVTLTIINDPNEDNILSIFRDNKIVVEGTIKVGLGNDNYYNYIGTVRITSSGTMIIIGENDFEYVGTNGSIRLDTEAFVDFIVDVDPFDPSLKNSIIEVYDGSISISGHDMYSEDSFNISSAEEYRLGLGSSLNINYNTNLYGNITGVGSTINVNANVNVYPTCSVDESISINDSNNYINMIEYEE